MSITLADLCEVNPDFDDPKYKEKISNKKEFKFADYVPDQFGDPRNHQLNTWRQWGPQAPPASIAFFWRTGAGKGRVIAKIMEMIADNPRRFENKENTQRFIIIVQASVIPQWKTELAKHDVFTTAKLRDPASRYKNMGKEQALSISISKVVKLMKIDEFSIELRTKTPEQIRKAWSTDILVLDEAHVVRSKTVLTDDEIKEFDVKEKKKGFEKRTKDLDEEGQKINYMQMRRLFLYTNAGSSSRRTSSID